MRLLRWSVLCLIVTSAACSRSASQTPASPPSNTAAAPALPVESAAKTEPVHAVFHNVNFRLESDVIVEIRHLEGSLVATHPGQIAAFDDPKSFRIAIDTGPAVLDAGGRDFRRRTKHRSAGADTGSRDRPADDWLG